MKTLTTLVLLFSLAAPALAGKEKRVRPPYGYQWVRPGQRVTVYSWEKWRDVHFPFPQVMQVTGRGWVRDWGEPQKYDPTKLDELIRQGHVKIEDAKTGQPLLPRSIAGPPRK